jgi:hypothetical protein
MLQVERFGVLLVDIFVGMYWFATENKILSVAAR